MPKKVAKSSRKVVMKPKPRPHAVQVTFSKVELQTIRERAQHEPLASYLRRRGLEA